MASGLKGDEKSRSDDDEAKKKRDKIFQLSNAVGKAVIGGAADGAQGEKGGEDAKGVGKLFQEISQDGDGSGLEGDAGHEADVDQAKDEGELETPFASSGRGRGGGKHGWRLVIQGEVR